MKTKSVPSGWLSEPGHRLAAHPYHSEARDALSRLRLFKTVRLSEITNGGKRGIFNGPRFARHYVDSPAAGVPLLSGSDVLASDISTALIISQKQVATMPEMVLNAGTTLITSYGTVGRCAYVRGDMVGMVGSDNVMKIVPATDFKAPGYLYAFLASRFGVALASVGATGGVVQFLPPERLYDLPVPRLGSSIETKLHQLIQAAASMRDASSAAYRSAILQVHKLLGWSSATHTDAWTTAQASSLGRRMDAFSHSNNVVAAREALARARSSVSLASKVAEVFEPNRGPRLKVDDPAFGVPFLSSSEVFRLDPTGEYSVSRRRTPHLDRLLVTENDLLLPRSGQLGGVIGRAVLPLPTYYGDAASEHLVRIRCKSREDAFFLWPIFASEPGYLATIGTAFGSSIPSLDCQLLSELKVPWFDSSVRSSLSALVASAVDNSVKAIEAERKAVRMVEDAIEKGAN